MRAPKSCLIIDEDEQWRKVFTTLLLRIGITTITESGDPHALSTLYQRELPDLVIFDVNNVDIISSISALAEATDHRAKIIAVSTIAKKEVVLSCIYGGAFHYIIKNDNIVAVFQSLSTAIKRTHFPDHQVSPFKPQQIATIFDQERKQA